MGTELSSLFRRNAEICTEMSSSAKSIEVREQWTELAAHWRRKAEANEAFAVTASDPQPLINSPFFGITQLRPVDLSCKPTPAPISTATLIPVSTESPTVAPNRGQEASREPTLAPVFAPEDKLLPIEGGLNQSVMRRESPDDKSAALDEHWRLLIADIRAKYSSRGFTAWRDRGSGIAADRSTTESENKVTGPYHRSRRLSCLYRSSGESK